MNRLRLLNDPILTQRRPLLYFAFGSNLCPEQMKRRCPGAREVGPATLAGHELAFGRMAGRDDGVATVVPRKGSSVRGVLWSMTPRDVARLDGFEGHPGVYVRSPVVVRTGKTRIGAFLYVNAREWRLVPPSVDYLSRITRQYVMRRFPVQPLLNAVDTANEERHASLRVRYA